MVYQVITIYHVYRTTDLWAMADAVILEEDAVNFARMAVQMDTSGSIDGAKFYYMVRICPCFASASHCLNYMARI